MRIFAVIILVCLWFNASSQNKLAKIYRLEDVTNANPDTVFALSLSKKKLSQLPIEIWKFKNLRELYLDRNHLSHLPDTFDLFEKLEYLNLDRNDLEIVPLAISRLNSLKTLVITRNQINIISGNLYYCSNLEEMDFYDNPIGSVEKEIYKMNQLKKLDIRGVMMSTKMHDEVKSKLHWASVLTDPPCKCLD
jgi:Leucine-rich repeat (LRR) protein